MVKKASSIVLIGILAAGQVMAAAPVEKYDYPELSVVPRASERLQREAQTEDDYKWTQFLPIQVSALSTLIAGVQSNDSVNPQYSYVGMGIGAGWLVMSGILMMTYHPYAAGQERVAPMAKGSVRDQLARERAAEEELHHAAVTGRRLRWLSTLSNLGASVYMLSKGGGSNTGAGTSTGNTALGFQIASAALSLAPMIFRFHWNDVYDEQSDYKKKIYAPIARPTLLPEPGTQGVAPGLELAWRF